MADVSSATSTTPLTAADLNPKPAAVAKDTGTKGLGQDDFMKLLVAQMQNQNPLDPQNASDLATQLAQFSSLDGITKLNENFSSLLLMQGINQATGLIGKNVKYQPTQGGNAVSGLVQSVQVNSGAVNLVINGANVSLSQVSQIG